MGTSNRADVAQAGSTVLITLAAGQFLMTLDSSVMNVAIATVAALGDLLCRNTLCDT
jgi:hypothetical protein